MARKLLILASREPIPDRLLGDTAALPSEFVGATIVVQARDGQIWTSTVTAVLDRSSDEVIVTDSGRPATP